MGRKIKKLDISITVVCIFIISGCLLFFPSETTRTISNIKYGVLAHLSPLFLWLGLAIFVYSLYLCFSKFGDVRLGNCKPEFSTFSWVIMVFCTGMGSNLMYWSAIEWIYYYQSPPLGVEPFSQKAAELSVTYGGYHWSIIGWAIYAIGTITLGLRYYNKQKPGLSLSDCCEKVGGRFYGETGRRVVELIFLFGAIGGYTTMISFVVPMYCKNLSILFGVENNFTFQLMIILCIAVIFTISTLTGMKRGIKKLSKVNVLMAMALIFIIILVGPTMFIVKSVTNSLGFMLQNFWHMSLWTDFIANSGFPEDWTVFYWAWWIGAAPAMWIFIAKISKGRTVRQTLLGIMLSGSLGCWLYFGGISNYGLHQQLTGKLDLVKTLAEQGPETVVSQLVLSLPMGKGMLLLWTITGLTFLITTLDSVVFTLAVSTTYKIKENESPTKRLRLFWSVLMIMIPVGLMYAGAPMATLQACTVLTAVPLCFITVITILSGYRYLQEEAAKKIDKSESFKIPTDS